MTKIFMICSTCQGKGTVTGIDSNGNPTEIACPTCLKEGQILWGASEDTKEVPVKNKWSESPDPKEVTTKHHK